MVAADGPLTPFAEGIWVDTAPVRFLGMQLTTTMTVLRLGDGNLLLYSPVALTQARQSAIEALGPVAHLYAPNLFHHRWIGEWAAAFPSARLHAPVGLAKKRGDLRIDRIHNAAPEPAFAGVLEERHIDGFRLEESVVVYRPAGTLVVADLVHNVGRPQHRWTNFYSRTMGFHDRVALSRVDASDQRRTFGDLGSAFDGNDGHLWEQIERRVHTGSFDLSFDICAILSTNAGLNIVCVEVVVPALEHRHSSVMACFVDVGL